MFLYPPLSRPTVAIPPPPGNLGQAGPTGRPKRRKTKGGKKSKKPKKDRFGVELGGGHDDDDDDSGITLSLGEHHSVTDKIVDLVRGGGHPLSLIDKVYCI